MRLASTLLILSGALGLGYQVLWVRTVLHFTGVAAHAWAVVLASFMAGLAIGSRWFGDRADRVARPLALYGWLELGVGAFAVVYLPLAALVSRGHHALVTAGDGGALALIAEALAAGILLLPPTILLGGTWPAMLKHATRDAGAVGRNAAGLYAANAAGAVVGAVAMAYFVLPALGITGSLMLLASCNAVLALVALALGSRVEARRPRADLDAPAEVSRGAGDSHAPPSGANDENESKASRAEAVTAREVGGEGERASSVPSSTPKLGLRATSLVLFALGFASFSFEIAWTRFFGISLGSSTYSFALVVATFVGAIALGGLLLATLDRRLERPLTLLATCQIVAAVAVLLPMPFLERLPHFFLRLTSQLRGAFPDHVFAAGEVAKALTCALVMLVPALFLGMAIPLAVKAHSRRLDDLGRSAGRLHAANTWGNVLGGLAAGMVLLPLLGADGILASGAVLLAVLGTFTLTAVEPSWRRPLRLAALAGGIVVLAVIALSWARWDPRWFTLEPARGEPHASPEAYVAGWEVVFAKDDPAAHVLVTRATLDDGTIHQTLFVSGKPDATNGADMPTQLLLGHVPAVLHPDAESVLVIGLASGVTAGAVLAHPVEEVEVVELARAMVPACRTFSPWNGRPLDDPRLRVVIDDARSHLLHSERTWDVIISEPSNPWVSGVGSLFTRELYAAARERLGDDGLYVQWVQTYEVSDATLAAIFRTFRGSFPHVLAFFGRDVDLMLVGSNEPLEPRVAAIEDALARPRVAEQLESIGIEGAADLLAFQAMDQVAIDWIAAGGTVENTDDNLLLEYRAPRELAWQVSATHHLRQDVARSPSPTLLSARWPRPRCPSDSTARVDARVGLGKALEAHRLGWGDLEALRALGSERLVLVHRASCDDELGWLDDVLAWPVASEPVVAARQRSLRLALLVAAGRRDAARAELRAWLDGDAAFSPEESLLAACRIDPDALCRAVAEAHARQTGDARFERFLALREPGGRVGR